VPEWLAEWQTFAAPAQNGIAADRAGSIAIRSTGAFPIRPGDGRGDEIRDGSRSGSDWTGYLPLADYPFARDPAQGFLASANQQPVDPRVNNHYFGVDWYSPWRAMRINQLLRADSSVTPDAMRGFQSDARSVRADLFIPYFRAALAARGATGDADTALTRAGVLLSGWNHEYTPDDTRAVLFETVMEELASRLFDELIPPGDTGGRAQPVASPQDMVVLELLGDSASAWWDDHRTPATETRDEILRAALREGYRRTVREHGAPDGPGWRWSNAHHANLNHLLRVPALSALGLPVRGGTGTLDVSPRGGTHGPSWRMVVELGPEVRAWGTYPGGQSGNPASPWYLDRLPGWLHGDLDTLLFPSAPSELPRDRVRETLTLTGGR
jgi:penicillin amidase